MTILQLLSHFKIQLNILLSEQRKYFLNFLYHTVWFSNTKTNEAWNDFEV